MTEKKYAGIAQHDRETGTRGPGWRLQVIAPASGTKRLERHYRNLGLEVHVGDFVSNGVGGKLEKMYAILTLDPKERESNPYIPKNPSCGFEATEEARQTENVARGKPLTTRQTLNIKYQTNKMQPA
jgi:hypothetical protein